MGLERHLSPREGTNLTWSDIKPADKLDDGGGGGTLHVVQGGKKLENTNLTRKEKKKLADRLLKCPTALRDVGPERGGGVEIESKKASVLWAEELNEAGEVQE